MCNLLDINFVNNPGKYFGLPTIWGKSKEKALAYFKDHINIKIDGWKLKSLSPAGKEILIKYVASAVSTYPMSYLKFPMAVWNDINSVLSNFWWGFDDSSSKLHWKSWAYLGKPKSEGSIGFHNFILLTWLF